MSSADQLIATFNSPEFRFLWYGQNTFIDHGYTYLKAHRYSEGLDVFSKNKPSKVAKFKTIQNWIEQKLFDQVDNLLEENIRFQREKWNI